MNELRLGTAEWADPSAFTAQHTFRDGRFWLGRSPMGGGDGVGYVDDRHICLVSGSRSGKGTTTIIPNLCLWPGSVVVVDPKGENATVAAARRGPGSEHCEGMGQAVHVLDPFEEAQVSPDLRSRFNPMDALDPADPEVIEEVSRIAEALVVVNEGSESASWERSARSMVKGLILHVLTSPRFEGRRNLVTVRELLTRGDHESLAELRKMDVKPLPSAQALLWEGLARNTALGGVISGIGEQFADQHKNAPKQFIGAHGPAVENTDFIDSPKMRECLKASDFRMSDLKTDPRGVSIFLSLPQRHMDRHYRWLRLMVALITSEMQATRGRPATGHPILMCLDEFAGLKRMEVIENAVAQIAGYGVKLFFVLQSLEQMKAVYKDNWETFLTNSSLKLFYGVEDHFTREYVSKLIGDTEILRTTRTSSDTEGSSQSRTLGRSESDTQSDSNTRGTNWGETQNNGTSRGGSSSNSFKSLPLNLRGTASFFSALTGSRQSTNANTWGSNHSSGTSSGGSESVTSGTSRTTGTNYSETVGTSQSHTSGVNEGLHKRPLITPDEVGRYLSRIDDKNSPAYPGMGLVLIAGQNPAVVRRVNYYEDRMFLGLYEPHPDHAHQVTRLQEYNVGFYGLDKVKLLSGLVDPELGPVAPKARWLVAPGERIEVGMPILEVSKLIGQGFGNPRFPGTLTFESPVRGEVIQASSMAQDPFQERWMLIVADSEQTPNRHVIEHNQQKVDEYCDSVRDLSGQIAHAITARNGIFLVAGILGLLALIFGWPSRLLGVVVIVGAIIAYIVHGVRSGPQLAYMEAVRDLDIDAMTTKFVSEGPFTHQPKRALPG